MKESDSSVGRTAIWAPATSLTEKLCPFSSLGFLAFVLRPKRTQILNVIFEETRQLSKGVANQESEATEVKLRCERKAKQIDCVLFLNHQ